MKTFISIIMAICLGSVIFTSCGSKVNDDNNNKNIESLDKQDKYSPRDEQKISSPQNEDKATEKESIENSLNIKIYYYNPVDDVMVSENVKYVKGEGSTLKFFENRFKYALNDKTMSSMPETTKINSIKADEKTSTVTMDVSENFTSKMNIGGGVEVSLIQSIAKTLGEAYNCETLIITHNGEKYEGSHIIIDSENPIKVKN
ncbi:MAG: GerMN domain-containing protein [Clostridium sp.]